MWENRREQVAMARPTARPSTAAPPRATLDDHELARLAIAGDGDAFAQLYDRHERRVYGYCLRMLGAPDDAADATQETFMRLLRRLPALEGRDVNFIAYALTTARNACYDAIEARRRVQPVAEPIDRSAPTTRAPIGLYAGEPGGISLDPERAALLAATRKDVRAANARLPERQREVLALRELEQLSYEQIGEIVHLNENAVAQLISRARIRLREEIRGDALASIAASSPDCERALALLARLQDTQRSDAEALGWLGTHMDSCETCRLSRVAMEEVGVSYRALGPIVVLAWLRHATIAHAARFVGADWSHIADSVPRTTPSSTSPADARATPDTQIPAAGHGGASGSMQAAMRRTGMAVRTVSGGKPIRETRLRLVLGAAVLCLILAVVLAGSVAPDSRVPPLPATSALSSTRASRGSARPRTHARRLTHRESHSANPSLVNEHGATPAILGSGNQSSTPTPVVHRTRRATHRRSTHHQSSSPATPTSGAPAPQPSATTPTATTPTATTPAPSPPSSGSTGSGSGGGETPTTPTETPTTPGGPTGTGSPSGGETGHGCALAIAC
jgi:RNA polymerase sigma factor (sigma-70 family)